MLHRHVLALWLLSLGLCFKEDLHVSLVQIHGFLQVLREQPAAQHHVVLAAGPLGASILQGAVHVLQLHLQPVLPLHRVPVLAQVVHQLHLAHRPLPAAKQRKGTAPGGPLKLRALEQPRGAIAHLGTAPGEAQYRAEEAAWLIWSDIWRREGGWVLICVW